MVEMRSIDPEVILGLVSGAVGHANQVARHSGGAGEVERKKAYILSSMEMEIHDVMIHVRSKR